ncbi:nuclear receptor subfamily 1 group D member 2 [Biomphalaria pfeifferi]|uniref:Nuclear receptor subfamily 1 group D member 2 n=1 Tax=Biomphalaria pfeifferi TaxID=112525 RepID=A0AAD8ATE1_BIOPF|nr:nuclear receptor subfamily 1 group D member 2 [Biomphalaria pfeifferi]
MTVFGHIKTKFFIRASKLERPRYVCLRQKDCVITKESRVHCQYCRYQKCLQLNMFYPKDGQKNANKVGVQEIPCRVCAAPSSGFHFGALTCEGCKGFFRRMVKEREAYNYKCSKSGTCEVNAMTRNMCKACRYNKCIQIGMSVDGSRIGRQPNAVKHAISLEAKKQIALKTEPNLPNSKMENFNFDSVVLQPCLPGDVELDQEHCHNSPGDIRNPKQENLSPLDHSIQFSDVGSPLHSVHLSDSPMHKEKPRIASHEQSVYSEPHCSQNRDTTSNHPFHMSDSPCCYNDQYQSQEVGMDLSVRRSSMSSLDYPPPLLPSTRSNSFSASMPPKRYPPATHMYNSGPLSPRLSGSLRHSNEMLSPNRFPHQFNSQDNEDAPPKGYNPKEEIYKASSHPVYRTDPSYTNYSSHVESSSPCFKDGYRDHVSSPGPRAVHMHNNSLCYHEHEHPGYQRSDPEIIHDSQDYYIPRGMQFSCAQDHQNYSPTRVKNVHHEPYPQSSVSDRSSQHNNMNNQYHNGSSLAKKEPHPVYHKEKPYQTIKSPTYSTDREFIYQTDKEVIYRSPSELDYSPPMLPKRNNNKVVMQFPDGSDITFKELDDILIQAANALFHICLTQRAKSRQIDESRFTSVDTCWEKMMEHFNFHAKCIVRFAKKVPGFRLLKIEDQVLLLRTATYGLVILIHSREYEPETGFYNYFNFCCVEQDKIMELFPEFQILLSHFKHTGVMAKRLMLTDLEYAYLSCMLLLNDEYQGLVDSKKVKELKEKYMEAFHEYEFHNFPNGDLRFGEMLLRLSEFSQFSMQHNISVSLVITKNSQLHIPQLYAEMYNSVTTGEKTPD